MRVCVRCRKVGAGVDRCIYDRAQCRIIDKGVVFVERSDVLSETPEEGVLFEMPATDDNFNAIGDAAPRPASPFPVPPQPAFVDPVMLATPGGQEGAPVVPAGILPADDDDDDDDNDDDCPTKLKPKEVTSGTVAGSILSEAAGIVEGVRNQQHGHKERSFEAIARMWTAYLHSRQYPTGKVRAHDVAHMMVLTKQMRAEWGAPIRDHYVDAAGYSGIAGELALGAEESL